MPNCSVFGCSNNTLNVLVEMLDQGVSFIPGEDHIIEINQQVSIEMLKKHDDALKLCPKVNVALTSVSEQQEKNFD